MLYLSYYIILFCRWRRSAQPPPRPPNRRIVSCSKSMFII